MEKVSRQGDCFSRPGARDLSDHGDATIKKNSRYYRNSIIRNKGNILAMKRDIYAILQDCSSTNIKPKHTTCPIGCNSWCFFSRVSALQQKPAAQKVLSKHP